MNAKPLVFEELMKIGKRRTKSGDAVAIAISGAATVREQQALGAPSDEDLRREGAVHISGIPAKSKRTPGEMTSTSRWYAPNEKGMFAVAKTKREAHEASLANKVIALYNGVPLPASSSCSSRTGSAADSSRGGALRLHWAAATYGRGTRCWNASFSRRRRRASATHAPPPAASHRTLQLRPRTATAPPRCRRWRRPHSNRPPLGRRPRARR